MSGICLFKTAHSCSSSDGLQIYEQEDGSITGYCFSCKKFEPNPLGEHTLDSFPVKKRLRKTKEEIQEEISEIATYPTVDLVDRKLRKDVLERYGVKVGFDEETASEVKLHYYPYTKDSVLTAYKVRLVEGKKMWTVGDQSDVDLFGWEQAVSKGAKRLIITEGELDAVALTRILEMHTPDKYKDYIPAVCSLPHGAGSAGRDIARLASKIRRHFQEVSFCFDNDEAGERATEDACKAYPEATVITLPSKDANDCILEGRTKAAHKAVSFNTQKPKNTRLVWGDSLHEAAREAAQWGYSWPWGHINETTRGIRKGETIYIGSGVKMG